jgi:hypothetical protein
MRHFNGLSENLETCFSIASSETSQVPFTPVWLAPTPRYVKNIFGCASVGPAVEAIMKNECRHDLTLQD